MSPEKPVASDRVGHGGRWFVNRTEALLSKTEENICIRQRILSDKRDGTLGRVKMEALRFERIGGKQRGWATC